MRIYKVDVKMEDGDVFEVAVTNARNGMEAEDAAWAWAGYMGFEAKEVSRYKVIETIAPGMTAIRATH